MRKNTNEEKFVILKEKRRMNQKSRGDDPLNDDER